MRFGYLLSIIESKELATVSSPYGEAGSKAPGARRREKGACPRGGKAEIGSRSGRRKRELETFRKFLLFCPCRPLKLQASTILFSKFARRLRLERCLLLARICRRCTKTQFRARLD